jgi:hypothetical protein
VTRALAAAAALGLGLAAGGLVAGCGLGAGRGTSGVSLLVTRDFGNATVGSASAAGTPGTDTVMRFLQRHFTVSTRFGGGFVQSINGLSGRYGGGRRNDWFYYVNGIEASRGAADMKLNRGDRVWWDRHDWSAAMRVPAVVGSFPEPFRSGSGGHRLPVRVDCAPGARSACAVVQRRLAGVGVPAARTALGAPSGGETLRVLVGAWPAIRRDPALRTIDQGPAQSGVYVRFDASGHRLAVLDSHGQRRATYSADAGLVAATRYADQKPTWVITGVDDAGLLSAARALTSDALDRRFALVTASGGHTAAPVGAGAS